MDTHVFALFAAYVRPLLAEALIEKIQAPAPDLLVMGLYCRKQKRQLALRWGRQNQFIYFSDVKFPVRGEPPAPIMRIRRYFGQKRIAAVVFQSLQRRIWLMGSGSSLPDGRLAWLCLDLVKGPSLHFLAPDDLPQADCPVWPNAGQLEEALGNWREWPVLTPALRKTLAGMEFLDQLSLIQDLESGGGNLFLYRNGAGRVEKVSAWPLANARQSEECREDVLEALRLAGDDLVAVPFFEKRTSAISSQFNRKRARIERLLQNLEKDEARLAAMEARAEDALLLQANLWRLEPDLKTASLSLPERDGPVALDSRFTILENMERLFKTSKRGSRGLALLAERRAILKKELAQLEPEPDRPENAGKSLDLPPGHTIRGLPKNIAGFVSSDGFALLRGKDGAGNRALRKLLAPHDIWAHVVDGPGAHVAIRKNHPTQEIPEKTLDEAGALAAVKSWLSASAKAPIMYAEARHVKAMRNAKAGNVVIDKIAFTRTVPVIPDIDSQLSGQKKAPGFPGGDGSSGF